MRSLLLYLSRHKALRRWMETSPLAWKLASRFVAGRTLEDALRVSRRLNAEGIWVTLDDLGENVTSLEEAAACRDVYLGTLQALAREKLQANVSIKLTQFGLDISEQACRDNVEQLAALAKQTDNFVRIDMESSAYTDRTLALAGELFDRCGSVGTVIQAYLYRSEKDVEMLCRKRMRVRLCKGAYLEPPEVAFPRKADVDRNFIRLMEILFDRGNYPAIATHDEALIGKAREMAGARGLSPRQFEFQMLYGIRRDIQMRLVQEGYRLRLYVPFGGAWYPYFMRRLAERPANILFLLKNLVRR